jgi:hypothetical protein
MLIVLVACAGSLLFLGQNPTGGLPLDDGYIYQTYAMHAAQGHWFEYTIGERSGGITGFLWFLIVTGVSRIAPVVGWMLPALWPMYVISIAALCWTGWLVYQAAAETSGPSFSALLVATALVLDPAILWGTLSGLELPVTYVVGSASLLVFTRESQTAAYRYSPWLMGLAYWARPEMLVLPVAACLVIAMRAPHARVAIASVVQFALPTVVFVGLCAAAYWWFTGLPLPSSFYLKVSGRHGWSDVALSTYDLARQVHYSFPIFRWYLAAIVGLVFANREQRRQLALPVSFSILFFVGRIVTIPDIGQVARYITPMYPALAVITSAGLARAERQLATRRMAVAIAALVAVVAWSLSADYQFARAGYRVHVRNIDDGAVSPARWIREHTPAETRIALEPVGAVGLYGDRPIVDIVGLTTPDMLGHGGDWQYIRRYLRARGANYLLYYPDLFPERRVPGWLSPVMTFPIPDNEMAASDPIVLYAVTD